MPKYPACVPLDLSLVIFPVISTSVYDPACLPGFCLVPCPLDYYHCLDLLLCMTSPALRTLISVRASGFVFFSLLDNCYRPCLFLRPRLVLFPAISVCACRLVIIFAYVDIRQECFAVTSISFPAVFVLLLSLHIETYLCLRTKAFRKAFCLQLGSLPFSHTPDSILRPWQTQQTWIY